MRRPPVVAVLLGTQLVFNVGFYTVVPFLAVVLREDYLLGGAAIGLVLGIRTFAQQGLFLVGGALTDLLGARRLILLGCAVRVAGFALLALAPDVPTFVVGTVLTGLGGALFSPALETWLAAIEHQQSSGQPSSGRAATDSRGPGLFALLAVVGETGAVVGPLLGAVLLGWGFTTVAATGAAMFVLVAVALAALLPGDPPTPARSSTAEAHHPPAGDDATAPPTTRWPSLRDRRFVAFAAAHSVNLLAFNQLYLGLPVETARSGAGAGGLAVVLIAVSLTTIVLQLPLARVVRRVGSRAAMATGYTTMAAGFAVLALGAPLDPWPPLPLLPALVDVLLLTLGHLVVGPTARALVPRLAAGAPLGTYYGLLATCGGVAVLVGNVLLGPLYDGALTPGAAAAAPWACLALVALVPALVLPRLLTEPTRLREDHHDHLHATPTS